jgi:tRNA nucleotidyltransferase (CCA-adding enzyme)
MNIYLVGGAVRDKLMGRKPNDFDYSVVLNPSVVYHHSVDDPFRHMVDTLKDLGYTVFLETPEHFTVRAKFPKWHPNAKLTADFVLARKEGSYSDGRRPDGVEPGTLGDDLARRDFSMNAIAEDESGTIIDPFDGVGAISLGLIEAVGDAKQRMLEDALRALRALRFSVTLGFQMSNEVRDAMRDDDVLHALNLNVSDERKMDELNKMFKVDPVQSIIALNLHPGIMAATFSDKVNLSATLKQKGFNK